MPHEEISSLLQTPPNSMVLAAQVHLCPSAAGTRVSVCAPRSCTFSFAEAGQWLLTASTTGELREATSLEAKSFKDTGLDSEGAADHIETCWKQTGNARLQVPPCRRQPLSRPGLPQTGCAALIYTSGSVRSHMRRG